MIMCCGCEVRDEEILNNFYASFSEGKRVQIITTGRKPLKGHVWSSSFIIFQHKVIKNCGHKKFVWKRV
jgi:hypothetical protein